MVPYPGLNHLHLPALQSPETAAESARKPAGLQSVLRKIQGDGGSVGGVGGVGGTG